MSDKSGRGSLYLIPVGLGGANFDSFLPSENRLVISELRVFIVENIKSAQKFLQQAGLKTAASEVTWHLLSKDVLRHHPADIENYLDEALHGQDVGLLSEAGVPCIADPGSEVVRRAHRLQIPVKPLIGPSSILLALMASGLSGNGFTFHGYLPKKNPERRTALLQLQKDIERSGRSQIFIEAPHRNQQLFADLIKTLKPSLYLTLARNLTLPDEWIAGKTIGKWRTTKSNFGKQPMVFVLGS